MTIHLITCRFLTSGHITRLVFRPFLAIRTRQIEFGLECRVSLTAATPVVQTEKYVHLVSFDLSEKILN